MKLVQRKMQGETKLMLGCIVSVENQIIIYDFSNLIPWQCAQKQEQNFYTRSPKIPAVTNLLTWQDFLNTFTLKFKI